MTDLRDWLAARTPPAAAALPLCSGEPPAAASAGEPGGLPQRLADLAAERLERAVRREGERRGAFHLLVADALLTYACEAALETDDPETALLDVVGRTGRRSG